MSGPSFWKQGERERHSELSGWAFRLAQRIGDLSTAPRIMNAAEQLRAGMQDLVTRMYFRIYMAMRPGFSKAGAS
jgi:hypothetical protein